MKHRMALWVAVVVGLTFVGGVCRADDGPGAPEITPYKEGSGNWHGFQAANTAYDAILSCNTNYGFYMFRLNMGGEEVTQLTRLAVYDEKNQAVFDSFEFHKNKDDVAFTSVPGKVSWAISPEVAKMKGVEYSGSLACEPRKITLTHNWTCREDVKGRVMAGSLKLGIPLLTGCPFEATLADGSVVKGEIPAELPEKSVFTPRTAGKALTSILFDTKKGKVRITFVPDEHLDMTKGNQLFLQTILHTYPNTDRQPYRRYELTAGFSLGQAKDVARSYAFVFEFPE